MTDYVATAPLVIATDEQGARHHLYEGSPLPANISKDEVKRLSDGGFIASPKVKKAEPKEGEAPAGNASREVWAEFAKGKGAPDEETREGGLSQTELREKYGK